MSKASKVAVIDYGMGNLRSVTNALQKCGADVKVISSPEEVGDAKVLFLPGVGALRDCVDALEKTGLADLVRDWIAQDRPFFGVCLGLQALFESSEEGNIKGLGVFPGEVVRFQLPQDYKIPHMGWNKVSFADSSHSIVEGLESGQDQFYFVHSYYALPQDSSLTFFSCEYGGREFTAGICRGNCVATQFHPEKSQSKGLHLYRNFLNWVEKL